MNGNTIIDNIVGQVQNKNKKRYEQTVNRRNTQHRTYDMKCEFTSPSCAGLESQSTCRARANNAARSTRSRQDRVVE